MSNFLPNHQQRINHQLEQLFSTTSTVAPTLLEAMRYAVCNGGKRLRPLLIYATGFALGITAEKLDSPACAVELVHAYSLIHDDLPAMDNDDFRRGLPTCHKKFGEATAILAGDALQALAFELLSNQANRSLNAKQCLLMVKTLAVAGGHQGMAGGQALDLQGNATTMSKEQLLQIHQLKTGALFQACIQLALIANDDTPTAISEQLQAFSNHLGLAYQIMDDILDMQQDTRISTETSTKITTSYSSQLGLAAAKSQLNSLYDKAMTCLANLNDAAEPLRQLTQLMLQPQ